MFFRKLFCKNRKDIKINRIKWYLKQLFLLTYRSKFIEKGEKHFCVWKMWLGHSYYIDDVIIK